MLAHLVPIIVVSLLPVSTTSCFAPLFQGERLILHLLDDDMMEFEHFFVYLELLMNDCAINCIFSEEEKDHVITSIRGHVTQAGIEFSTSAAWDFFLKSVVM